MIENWKKECEWRGSVNARRMIRCKMNRVMTMGNEMMRDGDSKMKSETSRS